MSKCRLWKTIGNKRSYFLWYPISKNQYCWQTTDSGWSYHHMWLTELHNVHYNSITLQSILFIFVVSQHTGTCEDILIEPCKEILGYSKASFPYIFDQQYAAANIAYVWPVTDCNPLAPLYFCASLYAECSENPRPLCRETCESARIGCIWEDETDCSYLPSIKDYPTCIGSNLPGNNFDRLIRMSVPNGELFWNVRIFYHKYD